MHDKSSQILNFLHNNSRLEGTTSCAFLAAGEYNENYLISNEQGRFVFRINHGTQLALENQIEYEFGVLKALSESQVTPLPYAYSMQADSLGQGVLLMEYLPGKPLDYARDLPSAARIFARIHAQPVSYALIVQDDPARDIAAESLGLIRRYPGPHYPHVRERLFDYHDKVIGRSGAMAALYADEPLCIVNTEVNSGNFCISETRACLVDWEKAVVSYRYQDLAHFFVPTTTLWKTGYRFSEEDKREFLRIYLEDSPVPLSIEEAYEKTLMMEKVILLRALSWCYMAYHEYTAETRELAHSDTFATITRYLDEAECFLR